MSKYGHGKIFVLTILLLAVGWIGASIPGAPIGQEAVKSRAYVGHENDQDIRNFVQAYPLAAGTRLDDCLTCHRSGVANTDTAREFSPCGYCHLIPFPNPRYATGLPGGYQGTLNVYGLAYEKAGRTVGALEAIAGADADGDGASNAAEIAALRHPGESHAFRL